MTKEVSNQAQKAEDEKRSLQRALKGKNAEESDSDEDLDLSDAEMDTIEKAKYLAKREMKDSERAAGELGAKKKGIYGYTMFQIKIIKI